MADTNYNRGEMEIADQKDTYGGFMSTSMYGGAMIIVALLAPIMIFAMNIAWPVAFLSSVILGVLIGVILKFQARWYVLLVAVAVLLAILVLMGKGIASLIG